MCTRGVGWEKRGSGCRAGNCYGVVLLRAVKVLTLTLTPSRHQGRLTALSVIGLMYNAENMLSQTLPADWKYISEGGATAVFSYRGLPHPILTGKVLRLRKASTGHAGDDDDDVPFQQKIISRFVDPTYLVHLQIVPLETPWVEAFARHHESSRPPERRRTSTVDSSRRTAVLASDLVSGIPCAVEVKVVNHNTSR